MYTFNIFPYFCIFRQRTYTSTLIVCSISLAIGTLMLIVDSFSVVAEYACHVYCKAWIELFILIPIAFYQTFYSLRLASYFDVFHLKKKEHDLHKDDLMKYGTDAIVIPCFFKYIALLPFVPAILIHIYQAVSFCYYFIGSVSNGNYFI